MSLDLFDTSIRNADAEVARQAAPDLPSTFAENFDTSLRYMSDWAGAASNYHARTAALADYGDYVFRNTGERLPSMGVGEGDVSIDEFNAAQAKVADRYPNLNLTPLSQADVDTMTRRRQAKAHDDFAALNGSRERSWGGTAGNLLGTLAGGFSDPVLVATLPLGGAGEVGVALRALEFAAISGGATAASAAATYSAHEAAVPGSSKEIPGEIASAALFGAALGGTFALLGKWLRAGEKPLPTSLREDVNAGASEAQFGASNVFAGPAGEAANRDAVLGTIDSILRGEKVMAGENFPPALRATAAEEASSALRQLTHDVAPEAEAFDRVPFAHEDAASYWENRLAAAAPEERAALGATDAPAATVARDLAPEDLAKLAADPEADTAVLRNLDRVRLEKPDFDYAHEVLQPDGTTQIVTRKLEDVLDEIDGFERAGKELLECATGMMAAE